MERELNNYKGRLLEGERPRRRIDKFDGSEVDQIQLFNTTKLHYNIEEPIVIQLEKIENFVADYQAFSRSLSNTVQFLEVAKHDNSAYQFQIFEFTKENLAQNVSRILHRLRNLQNSFYVRLQILTPDGRSMIGREPGVIGKSWQQYKYLFGGRARELHELVVVLKKQQRNLAQTFPNSNKRKRKYNENLNNEQPRKTHRRRLEN